jgi:peptidoglycan/LPS O-acetylase OafA/YrhL
MRESAYRPPQRASSASDRRIPELDGIRGVACLAILVWHYLVGQIDAAPHSLLSFSLRPFEMAWSGVDLFFVLSGFLLGGILIDHRKSPHRTSTFYIRRACRIFPIYFVWLFLFVLMRSVVSPSVDHSSLFSGSFPLWSFATYTQNVLMSLHNRYGATWMGITWSLAIEEQFYLVLPALVFLLPIRRLPTVVIVATVLAIACRVAILILSPSNWVAPYVLFCCRWDAPFAGVLGAWLVRQPFWTQNRERSDAVLRKSLFALGIGVLALFVYSPRPEGKLMASVGFTCMAFFYLAVILAATRWSMFAGFFRNRLFVFCGTISYGIYLMHQGVSGLLHGYLRGGVPELTDASGVLVTLLAIATTFGLSWVSYRYFEKPIVRWGHQWGYDDRPAVAPIAVAARSN